MYHIILAILGYMSMYVCMYIPLSLHIVLSKLHASWTEKVYKCLLQCKLQVLDSVAEGVPSKLRFVSLSQL